MDDRELEVLNEAEDLKTLINTPEGLRFIRRLMARCKVLEPSYTQDDRYTCYLEGVKAVGLTLLSDIKEACPHKIQEILIEEVV